MRHASSLLLIVLLTGCDPAEVDLPIGSLPGVDGGAALSNAPIAEQELCDGYDNNLDGQIDEGCSCTPGAAAACFPGLPAQAGIGICAKGTFVCVGSESEFGKWGSCEGAVAPAVEICGNGIDEDCDGADLPCGIGSPPSLPDPDAGPAKPDLSKPKADAKAPPPPPPPPPATECTTGQTQPCYAGPAGTSGVGACKAGTKTCAPSGSYGACVGEVKPGAEVCGNAVDEDCDGKAPACPPLKLPLFFLGDCVTAACPPSHPYPVGCQVIFSPGDSRGCVANAPGSSLVYFQAGDQCDKGLVTGFLLCDTKPGIGLNLLNCPMIGKTKFYYPTSPAGCPPVH